MDTDIVLLTMISSVDVEIVQAVETLIALANRDYEADPSSSESSAVLNISLDTLGSALGYLIEAQALRFTDLLRIGEDLCRVQQSALLAIATQQKQHFAIPRHSTGAAANDDSDLFAEGLHGFFRLLSPEMPSSIKQFSLWALTSMLRNAEQLSRGGGSLSSGLVDAFLSPSCATLLLALPRSNQQLQLQAALFTNVILHLAKQNASLANQSTYELWMKQIRYWSSCSSPALQLESALCLRTLSSSPRGRQFTSESPETMTALYDLARRLHESAEQATKLEKNQKQAAKQKTNRRNDKRQQLVRTKDEVAAKPLDISEVIAMQNHVSRAVRNICTSFQDGEAALTSSSSSSSSLLLLHSKRNLPMSQVFRGALDLSDLPVVGAEEYESSTEVGWIDILTSWTGSPHRDVRRNAIETLVHLAEEQQQADDENTAGIKPSATTATQDHILQAWLTSMLQHIRHLSGGGEILAVKQVEKIAKLSDGLTPGNEKVLFNPAVVDAGAAALAVLAENHHEELIQQGVIPLMALLSRSSHSSEQFDLKIQCSRVIANLVASSCAQLNAQYESHGTSLLLMPEADRHSVSWKRFVADNFDVQSMLRQTLSGKHLLRELHQWGKCDDPMRRSSFYRVVKNMEAYRDFVERGRLERDVYCEGVHPIVPFDRQEDGHEGSLTTIETDMPSIDVVFVHGLRGHPFGTWRTDMGSSLDGKNDIWPDVLLANDLRHSRINARLITLGYEAGMVSWSSPWPTLTLQERGKVMLDALYAANIGRSKRADRNASPVVFVTHSMGGILVKKMLLLAKEQAQQQQQEEPTAPRLLPRLTGKPKAQNNLAANTRGVVFLAVPHFGSDLAKGIRSESVRSLIKTHPAIQDLAADASGRLESLNDAFKQLGIGCMSIGEARPAPLGLGLSAMVVKPESANPGVGSFHVLTDSDHMTICKAKSSDEPHYQAILRYIRECAARY